MGNLKVEEIPADLQETFFDMIRSSVKARLSKDPNYPSFKGKGMSDNLDKLQ
jgi:hypothetical protein